jgi:hypothetical protein
MRWLRTLGWSAALVLFSTWGSALALAEEPPPPASPPVPPPGIAAVRAAVQRDRRFVVHVTVPLCANDQIDCGAAWAGRPGDLDKNLYWGAIFGVRTWMERARSDWEKLAVMGPEPTATGEKPGPRLDRRVYRRWVKGAPFGLAEGERVEEIVVFDALHGDRIDDAVRQFWREASEGGSVSFVEKGETTPRTLPVTVAGYAGHNRMLDGLTLPAPKSAAAAAGPDAGAKPGQAVVPPRTPVPSFVLACLSDRTFGPPLRAAGSPIVLDTTALVAPEAYLIDAVLHALGDGKAGAGVREAAVQTYVQWQKLTHGTAASMFRTDL